MLINKRVPFKYLLSKVWREVLIVLAVSSGFHVVKLLARAHVPEIPIHLPTILGTSIALILAFNLSQSYDRWWEARKIWGAIVNDSRSLVVQIQGYSAASSENGERAMALLRRIALRQIAWCYSLGQSLRGTTPLDSAQRPLLTEEDFREANAQKNRPLALLAQHARDVGELHGIGALDSFQQVHIGQLIVRLCDAMGMAERIKSTVFPVTYRTFVHYFIYLFLIVLSIALVETVGMLEIPILTLVASTFFLIEKTARHMQDPFENRPTDTAVTAIARTIEINIRQLLKEADVPKPAEPTAFYLL